jgi:CRP-like cAMP-binding protein
MKTLSHYVSSYFETSIEQSEKIASLFQEENLERNEYHMQFGDRQGKLTFIESGYLRLFKQTEKKEVTQWISSSNEFTTDLGSLLFNQSSRWNIQALTDCKLYTLNQSSYLEIQSQIPGWSEFEKLFLAKCFMSIEDRVFSFISMNSEERYKYLQLIKPELFQKVPQQYLASMLGMTPETFSRIRAKVLS